MNKKILIPFLISAILIFTHLGGFCDELEDAKRAGENLGNTVRDTLGSLEGMNERVVKPIMSGETLMKTVETSYECSTNHQSLYISY
ncbi:hypothetical protein DMNBHIDG_01237 [Candidatus Methanoperedenaceae archaeon GB37]|nr:hypothetical protein DMNBHIDG_01237 [Candidatus Methanoperedenaceae archaeon GB37]